MYTIEISDADVISGLQKLQAHLADFTPVFQTIGEQLEDSTEERFEQGVSPEGTPWSPKAQSTIDAYTRRGQTVNFKPLFGPNVDGLPLRKSFFSDAGPDSLSIGTNKIQAAVMQFGAAAGAFGARIGKDKNGREFMMSIPWGNIPARPFLGISAGDHQTIAITTEEWPEEVQG